MDTVFARIDKALGIYYTNCGRNDYYDENGAGKFMRFISDNAFDENDIDLELGDNVIANDCLFIDMDENFPLSEEKKTNDSDSNKNEIFKVIKYCYNYGMPPPRNYSNFNTEHKAHDKPLVINFDIFSNKSITCNQCSCEYQQRLLYSLKYYQTLDMTKETDQNKLMHFYYEIYTELLNDFVHIIVAHNDELDEIYDYVIRDQSIGFNKCNVLNCKWSARHNRDRTKKETDKIYLGNKSMTQFQKKKPEKDEIKTNGKEDDTIDEIESDDSDIRWGVCNWHDQLREDNYYTDDEDVDFYDVSSKLDIELEFTFIRDLFDGIHCYILHQYDFGYKIHKKEKQKYLTKYGANTDEESELSCIDNAFAIIQQIIRKKKNILGNIPRFNQSKKFTIETKTSQSVKTKNDNKFTFMDGVYEKMKHSVKRVELDSISRFLDQEEYDSVSLEMDILQSYQTDSIVSKHLGSHPYILLKNYFINYKLSKHSFSTGFVFYYWDYYKHAQKEEEIIEQVRNINDLGGYKAHELYVDKKYNDIKVEILNNIIYKLNMKEFKSSLTKANQLIDTAKARKTRASFVDGIFYYDIKLGKRLRVSNLLSVILYTDWSKLCFEFSKTFRKLKMYETLSSVIKRNQEYANWSRLLRETVETFGDYVKQLKGQYFCGMSCVMIMPQLNIRLCGPVSTSKYVEVATRFGGDEGIIIQLEDHLNPAEDHLRAFPCAWLSNYNGEEEYLFIGGYQPIRITTIKNLATAESFEAFIKPLFLFDAMTSGTTLMYASSTNHKTQKQERLILENLINSVEEDDKFAKKYHPYINLTFQKIINNKTTLILNYYLVNSFYLADILFENFEANESEGKYNLFKPILFKLFRNVQRIIVYTADQRRAYSFYPFSLERLLSLLCSASNMSSELKKIILKTTRDELEPSWLQNAFTSSIKLKYKAQNWDIKLIKTKNSYTSRAFEDCIIISKM